MSTLALNQVAFGVKVEDDQQYAFDVASIVPKVGVFNSANTLIYRQSDTHISWPPLTILGKFGEACKSKREIKVHYEILYKTFFHNTSPTLVKTLSHVKTTSRGLKDKDLMVLVTPAELKKDLKHVVTEIQKDNTQQVIPFNRSKEAASWGPISVKANIAHVCMIDGKEVTVVSSTGLIKIDMAFLMRICKGPSLELTSSMPSSSRPSLGWTPCTSSKPSSSLSTSSSSLSASSSLLSSSSSLLSSSSSSSSSLLSSSSSSSSSSGFDSLSAHQTTASTKKKVRRVREEDAKHHHVESNADISPGQHVLLQELPFFKPDDVKHVWYIEKVHEGGIYLRYRNITIRAINRDILLTQFSFDNRSKIMVNDIVTFYCDYAWVKGVVVHASYPLFSVMPILSDELKAKYPKTAHTLYETTLHGTDPLVKSYKDIFYDYSVETEQVKLRFEQMPVTVLSIVPLCSNVHSLYFQVTNGTQIRIINYFDIEDKYSRVAPSSSSHSGSSASASASLGSSPSASSSSTKMSGTSSTLTQNELSTPCLSKKEAVPDMGTCCVCMDKGLEYVFLPCGHICVCADCQRKLTTCPKCRNVIKDRHRIYM